MDIIEYTFDTGNVILNYAEVSSPGDRLCCFTVVTHDGNRLSQSSPTLPLHGMCMHLIFVGTVRLAGFRAAIVCRIIQTT